MFDQHLGNGTDDMARSAETMQLQLTEHNPNIQLYEAETIPQTMSLEQGSIFRPMVDGFNTMDDMMGINLDLNNDDDDFWWTRSWRMVRII